MHDKRRRNKSFEVGTFSESGQGQSKSERFEARLTPSQKELFEAAARLTGRSVSDFVVASAHEAASKALGQHERDQIICLSARDSRRFVEVLLNPPEPNEKLVAAAKRYKRRMGIGEKGR